MFSINRITTIFLNLMLVSLFCWLISVNVIHAKAVNQVATPSEQLNPENRQYFSYTSSGQKVYYGVVKNEFVVQFKEGVTEEQIEHLNAMYQTEILKTFRKDVNYAPIYLLRIPKERSLKDMLKSYSKEKQEVYGVYGYEPIVEWAMPALHTLNVRVIPTDGFTVMLSPNASFSDLTQLNQAHGVEILARNEKDGSYRLRVTSKSDLNSLDMANLYYEQPFIAWATPNYLSNQEIEDPETRQYWYSISIEKEKEDKRYLEVKPDEFVVQFKQDVTQSQIDQLNSKYGITIIRKVGRGAKTTPVYILSVPQGKRLRDVLKLYPQKKGSVHNVYGYEPIVAWTMPSFYYSEPQYRGYREVPTDEFGVMLKPGVAKEVLLEFNKQHRAEIIRNEALDPYYYLMRVTSESDLNSLDMANLYHEQPFTKWAAPNYLSEARKAHAIPNDDRFNEWNLHNQASDIEIDAPEAWDIANDASNSVAASTVKQKSNSQEDNIDPEKRQYFWYDGSGKKIYFNVKADEFVVQFKEGVTQARIDQLNSKYGSTIIEKCGRGGTAPPIYIMSVPKGYRLRDVLKLYPQKKQEVRNVYGYEPIVEWTMPSFYSSHGYRKVPTDEINVMLKPSVAKEVLLEFNKQHGVEIIRNDASHPYWHRHYHMRVTIESDLNSLDMANLYHEQPFTEWAAPNYLGGYELYATPNDSRFNEQWNLNQATDIDIDAPEAWDIANDASNSVAASTVKQKSNSQEDNIDPETRQYWYSISIEKEKEDKRYLEVKPDEFVVQFKPGVTQSQIDQLNSKYGITIIKKVSRGAKTTPVYILNMPQGKRLRDVLKLYPQKKEGVYNVYGYEPIVEWTMPSFYYSEPQYRGYREIPTDEFTVMLKPDAPKEMLLELNKQHRVEIVRNDALHPYWHRHYLMRVTAESDLNSLDMANLYHRQPFTKYASPNYLSEACKAYATIPNESEPPGRFNEQWNLHNQESDIDIDTPEAWDIANNASNGVVASTVKQKSNSQEDNIDPESRQYWYEAPSKKIYLEVKPDEFAVQFKQGVTQAQIDQLNSKYGVTIIEKCGRGGKTPPIYILSVPKGKRLKDALKLYPQQKKAIHDVYGYEPIVEWTMPSFYNREHRFRKVPTDEFTVMLKPGVPEEVLLEFNKQHRVEIIRHEALDPYYYHMRVTPESDLNSLDMANLYHQQPFTEWAAPNYLGGYKAFAIPNDDRFDEQWNLQQASDIDIDAPEAWDIAKGDNIIIAVIDTGIDMAHEDFSTKYEQTHYYDFWDEDQVPQDTHGHGTAVSGIAAAATNNHIGIAGVAWNSDIMPIRHWEPNEGPLDPGKSRLAIVFAVEHGAKVINCSWGGNDDPELRSGVQYASDNNRVVICAAGNKGTAELTYPADYNYPGVMKVGAIIQNGTRWGGSNLNPDVVAPTDVLSTRLNGGYSIFGMTSAAAPHVAGLAALLLSYYNPDPNKPDLTPAQVKEIIEKTADDRGSLGYDQDYCYRTYPAMDGYWDDDYGHNEISGHVPDPQKYNMYLEDVPGDEILARRNNWGVDENQVGDTIWDYYDTGGKEPKVLFSPIYQGSPPTPAPPTLTQNQAQKKNYTWALGQNYPNPFNPETWIPYSLKEAVPVTLEIYNARGQLVRVLKFGVQEPGDYLTPDTAAHWDGRNQQGEQMANGLYFYQLKAGDFRAIKKMVLLK